MLKPFEYYRSRTVIYPQKSDYVFYNVFNDDGIELKRVVWDRVVELEEIQTIIASLRQQNVNLPTIVEEAKKVGLFICNQYDAEAYKAHKQQYNDESVSKFQEFKTDLLDEHDVSDNPKADKAFEMAWDYGHASGYNEVASHFESLIELIK